MARRRSALFGIGLGFRHPAQLSPRRVAADILSKTVLLILSRHARGDSDTRPSLSSEIIAGQLLQRNPSAAGPIPIASPSAILTHVHFHGAVQTQLPVS